MTAEPSLLVASLAASSPAHIYRHQHAWHMCVCGYRPCSRCVPCLTSSLQHAIAAPLMAIIISSQRLLYYKSISPSTASTYLCLPFRSLGLAAASGPFAFLEKVHEIYACQFGHSLPQVIHRRIPAFLRKQNVCWWKRLRAIHVEAGPDKQVIL